MTKLEAILEGYGTKKDRCIWAAFAMGDSETTKEINEYYFDGFIADFPTPELCMMIIQKEYKRRVNCLSGNFLHDLICSMLSTDYSKIDEDLDEEVWQAVNDFMNSY